MSPCTGRVSMQRNSAPRPYRLMSRSLSDSGDGLRHQRQRPLPARAFGCDAGSSCSSMARSPDSSAPKLACSRASSGTRDSENVRGVLPARAMVACLTPTCRRRSSWSPHTARALRAPACRRRGAGIRRTRRSGAFSSARTAQFDEVGAHRRRPRQDPQHPVAVDRGAGIRRLRRGARPSRRCTAASAISRIEQPRCAARRCAAVLHRHSRNHRN